MPLTPRAELAFRSRKPGRTRNCLLFLDSMESRLPLQDLAVADDLMILVPLRLDRVDPPQVRKEGLVALSLLPIFRLENTTTTTTTSTASCHFKTVARKQPLWIEGPAANKSLSPEGCSTLLVLAN